MALLRNDKRNATVITLEPTELIAIRRHDFDLLLTNFVPLREEITRTETERAKDRISLENRGHTL